MSPVSLSLRGPSLTTGVSRPPPGGSPKLSSPPPSPPPVPPQVQARMQSAFESAAKRLGISSGDMATINGQIRDAVSGLDLSTSADPKATIEQTVDATLRDNGVDPQAFKSEVRSAMDASGATPPEVGAGMRSAGGQSAQWANLQRALATLDAAAAATGGGEAGASGDSDGDGDDGGAVISDFLRQSKPGTFVDVTA